MVARRHADYLDDSEPRDHEEPQDRGVPQRSSDVVPPYTGGAADRSRLVHVPDKHGPHEEPDRLSRGGR